MLGCMSSLARSADCLSCFQDIPGHGRPAQRAVEVSAWTSEWQVAPPVWREDFPQVQLHEDRTVGSERVALLVTALMAAAAMAEGTTFAEGLAALTVKSIPSTALLIADRLGGPH